MKTVHLLSSALRIAGAYPTCDRVEAGWTQDNLLIYRRADTERQISTHTFTHISLKWLIKLIWGWSTWREPMQTSWKTCRKALTWKSSGYTTLHHCAESTGVTQTHKYVNRYIRQTLFIWDINVRIHFQFYLGFLKRFPFSENISSFMKFLLFVCPLFLLIGPFFNPFWMVWSVQDIKLFNNYWVKIQIID